VWMIFRPLADEKATRERALESEVAAPRI